LVVGAFLERGLEAGDGWGGLVLRGEGSWEGWLTVEHGLDVEGHDLVPAGLGEVDVLAAPCGARVVEEDGETVGALLDFGAEGFDTGFVF